MKRVTIVKDQSFTCPMVGIVSLSRQYIVCRPVFIFASTLLPLCIHFSQWPPLRGLAGDGMAASVRSSSAHGLCGSPLPGHKSMLKFDAAFDQEDEFDGDTTLAGGVSENKESEFLSSTHTLMLLMLMPRWFSFWVTSYLTSMFTTKLQAFWNTIAFCS